MLIISLGCRRIWKLLLGLIRYRISQIPSSTKARLSIQMNFQRPQLSTPMWFLFQVQATHSIRCHRLNQIRKTESSMCINVGNRSKVNQQQTSITLMYMKTIITDPIWSPYLKAKRANRAAAKMKYELHQAPRIIGF